MSLSKPFVNLLGKYFEQLYNNPLRTRAISSAVISVCGNIAFQYISGNKKLNHDSIIAFGMFGLLFGGSIPYFFYEIIDRVITDEVSHSIAKKLIVERLIYAPAYQLFVIYMLARLEGKSNDEAIKQIKRTYWPILQANWKWLTIVQFVNLSFVPPALRVLFMNIVGFFWSIYLAEKLRRRHDKKH